MTIRLAFVGTGNIARVHARAAQKIDGVKLAAAVNVRESSMNAFAEEFDIPGRFTSIDKMVEAEVADAVIISTPNFKHFVEAKTAAEGGLHVLIEKPMTMNVGKAADLKKIVDQSGVKLMVAQNWRHNEEVKWLKDQIDSGKVGSIVRTHGYASHVNWGPGGWFNKRELAGGGALIDMGIHAIDTTRFLLGDPEPKSVYAIVGTHYLDEDVDDTAIVMIRWDNGAASVIEAGWWQPHSEGANSAMRVYGEKGFGSVFPTILNTPDAQNGIVTKLDPGFVFPRLEHGSWKMYENQMAAFTRSIKEDLPTSPDVSEGYINMQIIDAAYHSAQKGEVITFDAATD